MEMEKGQRFIKHDLKDFQHTQNSKFEDIIFELTWRPAARIIKESTENRWHSTLRVGCDGG